MPLSRSEIKLNARARMNECRGACVGVYVLMVVLSVLVTAATASAASWFIMPVLLVASCGFFTRVYQGENIGVSEWFSAMFDNYLRKLGAYLWMALWMFVWSLLFVIPGVIKGFSYMLTPYIIAQHPNVAAQNALRLSMRITDGYKMDLFITFLSFIGWELLSALTLGILELVFVGPYRELTFGGIYRELEKAALERGAITRDMLEGIEAPA
jgi:uncharacterized membrane protein